MNGVSEKDNKKQKLLKDENIMRDGEKVIRREIKTKTKTSGGNWGKIQI